TLVVHVCRSPPTAPLSLSLSPSLSPSLLLLLSLTLPLSLYLLPSLSNSLILAPSLSLSLLLPFLSLSLSVHASSIWDALHVKSGIPRSHHTPNLLTFVFKITSVTTAPPFSRFLSF